jgi:FlaA1/EpsC-like NDP-sugar epimerase
MSVLLSVGYLRREYVFRLALTYFGVLLLVGFIGIRYVARILLRAKYHAGHVRRVVIVGSDRIAGELGVKISRHPEMLCKVVGFLCPEDAPTLGSENCGTGIGVPPLAWSISLLLIGSPT